MGNVWTLTEASARENLSFVYSDEVNKTAALSQYCFSICIRSSVWVTKLHLTRTWGHVPASWCVTSNLEHFWLQKHVAHLAYDCMSRISLAPKHKHFRPPFHRCNTQPQWSTHHRDYDVLSFGVEKWTELKLYTLLWKHLLWYCIKLLIRVVFQSANRLHSHFMGLSFWSHKHQSGGWWMWSQRL